MFDLQGLNLYLIGMMGSGKSTIGKLLAERLEYRFIDTDITIEQIVGQNVAEIFESSGEAEFRQIETKVLAEVSAYTRVVVATGGGIAVKLENWNHLQQGLVIWLDATLDTLVERLKDDETRPLRHKLEQLLIERQARYAAADLRIPITVNLTPSAIVDEIFAAIPTVLKTPNLS